MLLEEGLHVLHVHPVVHVGVHLERRRLQLLVPKAARVHELGVLLVVVREAGELAALPVHVAHEGRPVQGHEEEEPVHQQTPLADVFELDGVGRLYHFAFYLFYYKPTCC